VSKLCEKLHSIFYTLPRFRFPFDGKQIPKNGIYILFEEGEYAHTGDRIVRVGTHTGKDQLRSRLKQHFVTENKDRSIFRKNIGRALLYSSDDPFLEQWNWDLTSRKAKEFYGHLLNVEKQKKIEKKVSTIIQELFSFVVVEVSEKKQRLVWETKIISTVSWCSECKPSMSWLGSKSPKHKIRESGLWLVNGLYKKGFTQDEFEHLESAIR
jgi:hypothetical protein